MKRNIYLDHAAATPVRPEVLEAMLPYFTEKFGNPSAMYALGREARIAVDDSRAQIAEILGCADSEIIFTGSGTESDNLALFGVMRAYTPPNLPLVRGGTQTNSPLERGGTQTNSPLERGGTQTNSPLERGGTQKESSPPLERGGADKNISPPLHQGGVRGGGHLIVSSIEHHAVLEPARALEQEGFAVTYLPVDRSGLVSPDDLENALRDDTKLVSIMYANNEIGTIQDIPGIVARLREARPHALFHTDACQASGYLELDVKKLGVDLMTLNASKIYGPKGVGLLYVRRGTPLAPLILGGGQEGGYRSGTENVPAIVGMAKALELALKEREAESARLTKLRDKFIVELFKVIPSATLNGHLTKRLPNNINITIPGVESEVLLIHLDEAGIAASTGSACAAGAIEPSHVLLALGLSKQEAKSSVRLTLGRKTGEQDLKVALQELVLITKK